MDDLVGQSSSTGPSITERVRQALVALKEPITLQALRKLCTMRTGSVCAALAELIALGLVIRTDGGYQLKGP